MVSPYLGAVDEVDINGEVVLTLARHPKVKGNGHTSNAKQQPLDMVSSPFCRRLDSKSSQSCLRDGNGNEASKSHTKALKKGLSTMEKGKRQNTTRMASMRQASETD